MKNIILIGMPACGKSTLGVVAAKHLGFDFIDCDLLIQREKHATLPELIARHGVEGFLDIEGQVISSIAPDHPSVIATGGSAIHREETMRHLRSLGTVIYLRVSLEALELRISAPEARGVAMKKGMSIADLYAVRAPLYEKYAHITIDEGDSTPSEMVTRLVALVKGAKVTP